MKNIINLYNDNSIYSIKHIVSIENEDDLNQFWDFLSISKNETHELIHSFITQFYNFALIYLNNKDFELFEIILEENDKFFYFTLHNKNISRLFKRHLKRTETKFIYVEDKITIKLNKIKCKKSLDNINKKHEKREKKLIHSVSENQKTKKIDAYTFLEEEDLQDLLKLSDDMQELMIKARKIGLHVDIFISLRSVLSMFCLTLRYYKKISTMASILTEFSNLININKEKFLGLSTSEVELINGFINNIDTWLRTLFIDGGANLYFMDNSLKADLEMIKQMINPVYFDNDDTSLDDIFDF